MPCSAVFARDSMLDLEQSIAIWRGEMSAGGSIDAETLDELESHLRDDLAALCASGLPADQAFLVAARLGSPAVVQHEFGKVRPSWLPSRSCRTLTCSRVGPVISSPSRAG